jgi:hypothetical protein
VVRQKNAKSKKSFTFVEIVFQISVIGILLAILLPGMNPIKLAAISVKDMSNLKNIAEGWRKCSINGGWVTDGIEAQGVLGDGDCRALKVSIFAEQFAGVRKDSAYDTVPND